MIICFDLLHFCNKAKLHMVFIHHKTWIVVLFKMIYSVIKTYSSIICIKVIIKQLWQKTSVPQEIHFDFWPSEPIMRTKSFGYIKTQNSWMQLMVKAHIIWSNFECEELFTMGGSAWFSNFCNSNIHFCISQIIQSTSMINAWAIFSVFSISYGLLYTVYIMSIALKMHTCHENVLSINLYRNTDFFCIQEVVRSPRVTIVNDHF